MAQGIAKTSISDMYNIIHYDQKEYIDAFNQILYNLLLGQIIRNEQVNFDEVKRKITQTEADCEAYYI